MRYTKKILLEVKRSPLFSYIIFKYDRDQDQYICPNGKRLKKKTKPRWYRGKLLKSYVSKETDCGPCQLRVKCLSNKKRFKEGKNKI